MFASENIEANKIEFNDYRPLVPSVIVKIKDEMTFSLKFTDIYYNIQEFNEGLRDLCRLFVSDSCKRNPDIDVVVNAFITDSFSLENIKFQSCSMKIIKRNGSTVIFRLFPTTCVNVTEIADLIGKTIYVPSLYMSCWIRWVDGSTYLASQCYESHDVVRVKINYTHILTPSQWIVIDGRLSEKCYEANITLKPLSYESAYKLHFYLTCSGSFCHNPQLRPRAYVRFNSMVGIVQNSTETPVVEIINASPVGIKRYSFVCLISKNNSYRGIVAKELKNDFKCQYKLAVNLPSSVVFMDAWDNIRFNITLTKLTSKENLLLSKPTVSVRVSNPHHNTIKTKTVRTENTELTQVYALEKPFAKGTSTLSIKVKNKPINCKGLTHVIKLHGICPPLKKMIFKYPYDFSKDTWLYKIPIDSHQVDRIKVLPYNYQPPSSKGKAIPLTENIYNADPLKPMYRASYRATRDLAKFKQCNGRRNRYVTKR